MSKEETKQQAESLIDEHVQIISRMCFPESDKKQVIFNIEYNAGIKCAILEVQSKIDLLEKYVPKHEKLNYTEFWLKQEINQQKEILKYLEKL